MKPKGATILALLTCLAPTATTVQAAPEEVKATPQRPSRSTNTYTTVPGYFELEAGWAHDPDGFDTPMRLKLGVSPRTEVYLGFSPVIGADVRGHRETGIGDTVIGGKVRFFESPDGDAAFEGFIKFPSADKNKGLGTGETDGGFRFIASRTWGRDHYDFNLGGDFAGVPDANSNDARWTTILTWSRPWDSRVNFYGEIFVQFLPAADRETITTDWGLHWRVKPSIVLDAGANIGLSQDAPGFELLVGITTVLGKAFHR